jgi:hypothetical protein
VGDGGWVSSDYEVVAVSLVGGWVGRGGGWVGRRRYMVGWVGGGGGGGSGEGCPMSMFVFVLVSEDVGE